RLSALLGSIALFVSTPLPGPAPLSLHDALPLCRVRRRRAVSDPRRSDPSRRAPAPGVEGGWLEGSSPTPACLEPGAAPCWTPLSSAPPHRIPCRGPVARLADRRRARHPRADRMRHTVRQRC